MRIRMLSVVGSTRPESRTRALVDIIHSRLTLLGVENVVWSLGERPLPMMDPCVRSDRDNIDDDNLAAFLTLAEASDAFVLGTPVYHDSYSGVLKNALDHLGSASLGGKVFGLVSHGGQRTTQAVAHLQTVVRSVHGLAIPTQVCTEDSDFEIDATGVVRGVKVKAIDDRIDRFAIDLTRHATVCRMLRTVGERTPKPDEQTAALVEAISALR